MLETAVLCLAMNVYYEARGEGVAGQMAVAQVTMNRVKDKRFPNTVCGVVTQHKQFSWTNTMLVKGNYYGRIGYKLKPAYFPKNERAWESSVRVARMVINGEVADITNGAIFYHEKSISPYWQPGRQSYVAEVGNHIFYCKSKSRLNYNKSIKGS